MCNKKKVRQKNSKVLSNNHVILNKVKDLDGHLP